MKYLDDFGEQLNTHVNKLLSIGEHKDVQLFEIQESAKAFASEFLKTREEIQRIQSKESNTSSCSSDSSEGFFRDSKELNYSNVEWKDI